MQIRRFLIIIGAVVIGILAVWLVGSRVYYSGLANEGQAQSISLPQISGDQLYMEKDGEREEFYIRGVHLSSFYPGYERNVSDVSEELILRWLQLIADMNANTIIVPYIQPPAFYNAIYDYNLTSETPLYIIHSVPIDVEAAITFYDAYQEQVRDVLLGDAKDTIDVVHGRATLLGSNRHHSGIYMQDVSNYVLGYILGTETAPEIVALTKARYSDVTGYEGTHFRVEEGSAFECFIAEMMDYTCDYEQATYGKKSLYTYLNSPDTDPVEHVNETNATKAAAINLNNIQATDAQNPNLFAGFLAHPNAPDFLDFDEFDTSLETGFAQYIRELQEFHNAPLVIVDTGMSSARGKSGIDADDGYDRGNMSEAQQGERLVNLLQDIETAGCAGVGVQSWQDNWGLYTTTNLKDYTNRDTTAYWQDMQASDESFGLLAFEAGRMESVCTVDGDIKEWKGSDIIVKQDDLSVSAKSDDKYLYLMVEKSGWSLNDDIMYVGIDITPKSGAASWEEEGISFPMGVDFILRLSGYNESRMLVQERYDIFHYLYTYYSNDVDKQVNPPAADSPEFGGLYLLNRKSFYLRDTGVIEPPVYYETGRLESGTANPSDPEYNSLTDFNKEGDAMEIRIPWTMLNVSDPLKRKIQPDFYADGLFSEDTFNDINICAVFAGADGTSAQSGGGAHRLGRMRNLEYRERRKQSYYILQEYWGRQ
ncbi:hypothetical protein LJC56_01650 [Christensenellaceae bacterium OttesenSCG-928-K19]|nr:hypothetical protein [Christensenellaceae bacterium OttesenSCG-928-K19]